MDRKLSASSSDARYSAITLVMNCGWVQVPTSAEVASVAVRSIMFQRL